MKLLQFLEEVERELQEQEKKVFSLLPQETKERLFEEFESLEGLCDDSYDDIKFYSISQNGVCVDMAKENRNIYFKLNVPFKSAFEKLEFDYFKISYPLKAQTMEVVKENGYVLKTICYKSNHPKDSSLFLVIAKKLGENSYVCWNYNNRSQRLSNGFYCFSYKEAMRELTDRLYDCYE